MTSSKQLIEELREELQINEAHKIIKEKMVDIPLLLDCFTHRDGFKLYNFLCKTNRKTLTQEEYNLLEGVLFIKPLTQEEYDLLKEVL